MGEVFGEGGGGGLGGSTSSPKGRNDLRQSKIEF